MKDDSDFLMPAYGVHERTGVDLEQLLSIGDPARTVRSVELGSKPPPDWPDLGDWAYTFVSDKGLSTNGSVNASPSGDIPER